MKNNFFIAICVFTVVVMVCVFCLCACGSETYINGRVGDSVEFSDGVKIKVVDYVYIDAIKIGFTEYTTEDTFFCVQIQVINDSNKSFTAKSDNIWLEYGDKKIMQVHFVKRWVDGFYHIKQGVTTTKTYTACFELSKDIKLEEIKLIIHKGEWMNSEKAKISLVMEKLPE